MTHPDLRSLEFDLEYRKALGDRSAIEKLERLHARSSVYGDGYGTLLPPLAASLAVAGPGPILELGAGFFSSMLLNEMCRATNRKLFTLDADINWIRMFEDLDLYNDHHIFIHVSDCWKGWEHAIEVCDQKEWALAVVDQTPNQTRVDTIKYLKDKAQIIVVHDAQNSFFVGLDETLRTFKHQRVYDRMIPPTTVVSDFNPRIHR